MFLFDNLIYFEEDSGVSSGDVEITTEENIAEETKEQVESTEVAEEVKKPKRVSKKKVEPKVDEEAEQLRSENQQLKLENKLQKVCNNNNLDSTVVKELIPDFDKMTEEGIENFITKLVEITPKLTVVKKAQPTPRIVPDSQVENKTVREKQLHQKYFGNRGGL